MICPKCGHDIPKDHLYCDVCGEEIQIVPDFDAVVDASLQESMNNLMEELNPAPVEETAEMDIDTDVSSVDIKKFLRKKIPIIIGGIIIFAALLITATILLYRDNSAQYQVAIAMDKASSGDYEDAIVYLDKAKSLEPGNYNITIAKVNCYVQMERRDLAKQELIKFMESTNLEQGILEQVYDDLVGLYLLDDDYNSINDLLLHCNLMDVKQKYSKYMALAPEFSYVEGTYDENIPLKLSSNSTGTIYYTTDGSDPTDQSQVYVAPIFLSSGKNQINALFINEYGVQSTIARGSYEVILNVPPAPQVTVYSGVYYEPIYIEAIVEDVDYIFYTTDGTEPTQDSTRYTGPIPMPLGDSIFKFVSISEEGLSSDVTEREFHLRIGAQISVEDAHARLVEELVHCGILKDVDGSVYEQGGINDYRYHSVVRMDTGDYYIFYEYYTDPTGVSNRTTKVYGVSIMTGEPYHVLYDDNGVPSVVEL